jgi:capsular exopolysaccharide synthesis family protein
MAEPSAAAGANPVDFRMYLGLILFRWQVIAVCFLYSLLGGVLFLQFTPKMYVAQAGLRSSLNHTLQVGPKSGWAEITRHVNLLKTGQAQRLAVENLTPVWGERIGDKRKMNLNVNTKQLSNKSLQLTVRTETPKYAIALLNEIFRIHATIWDEHRVRSTQSSDGLLTTELAKIEERIREAEEEVFEFERINDIRRVSQKAEQENSYIDEIVDQRRGIRTSLWMMEVQFPTLKDESAAVIEQVSSFKVDRKGVLTLAPSGVDTFLNPLQGGNDGDGEGTSVDGESSIDGLGAGSNKSKAEQGVGWVSHRYELLKARAEEASLNDVLKDDHPRIILLRRKIAGLQTQLKISAEMQYRNMLDNYRSLKILDEALEAAEYKWQAVNWARAQKQAELKRLEASVQRYEETYQGLWKNLQDIRIAEEMNIERFQANKASATSRPVWPDATQVLLIALGIGLGSGGVIAIGLQFLDNKIQSIKDVEGSLGVPFLGGVPYWIHSGLENSIRPIVTEEHSIGAVEAYRALRTSVVSAMAKANEKVLFVTSADAREGKTLTALNMAIMMAQMNRRVLLMDFDLRRGRLHRSLGLEKEPGITNVLHGELELKSIIRETRIDYLDLAPPGPAVENAPELLDAVGLANLLADVQDDYDFIIMDTSPVLRVTDTVILATQGVGVCLYVARVNHTPKPLVRYSLDVLKDAHVIGMVLNSIEMHKISSLYYAYQYPNYAYYSNAYSYGYSYSYYGDDAVDGGKKFRRKGSVVSQSKRSLGKWFRDTFLPMS